MSMRRLAVPSIGVALVVAAAALARQPAADAHGVPSVLRARTIELVDGRGAVRAQLKVEPGGEVVFRLRDARGTIRVKLGAQESGSGLLLNNERTEPGVQVLATRTGTLLTLQRGQQRRVLRP